MTKKILIVDDEEDSRKLTLAILEEFDIAVQESVREANDVSEAIKLLKEQEFDLVISDFRMPGKSGIDLLDYMQSNNIKTPFILLTGISGIKKMINTSTLKPFVVAQKTIDDDKFIEMVRASIEP